MFLTYLNPMYLVRLSRVRLLPFQAKFGGQVSHTLFTFAATFRGSLNSRSPTRGRANPTSANPCPRIDV